MIKVTHKYLSLYLKQFHNKYKITVFIYLTMKYQKFKMHH